MAVVFHPCHYSRMAGGGGFKGCLKSSPFKVSLCPCSGLGSSGGYGIRSVALRDCGLASTSVRGLQC